MDPKACYDLMVESAMQGDDDDAREAARNLLEWIGKGGFVPEGIDVAFVREMAT